MDQDILSQHEAFLRAIFDSPDDDTPRLVYADFLDENGEAEQAELIRLQCELSRWKRVEGAPRDRVIDLDIRQAELTRRFGVTEEDTDRGFQRFDGVARVHADQLRMRRVLRHWLVRARAHYFGSAVFELAGGVVRSAEEVDAILSLPAFASVRELKLCWKWIDGEDVYDPAVITATAVQALAVHPGALRLTSLALSCNNLLDGSAMSLIASQYLTNLNRLYLGGNNFSPGVWQQLRSRFGEKVVQGIPESGLRY